MEIVIDKNKIISDLHRVSAHLGMKLSAPELVASTADDVVKIEIMLSASLVELLKLLTPYATLEHSDNTVTYKLDMPANWRVGRMENLVALCDNFLVHSLFARWLDFVNSDCAALYRALNAENASAIAHILSLREKPQRD